MCEWRLECANQCYACMNACEKGRIGKVGGKDSQRAAKWVSGRGRRRREAPRRERRSRAGAQIGVGYAAKKKLVGCAVKKIGV